MTLRIAKANGGYVTVDVAKVTHIESLEDYMEVYIDGKAKPVKAHSIYFINSTPDFEGCDLNGTLQRKYRVYEL